MFAFVKYIFGWLLPTIMTAAAVGMFLTELTDTALAVLVQGAWWFVTVFQGINTLKGGMYGWSLIPRHNTELNYAGYRDSFTQLNMSAVTPADDAYARHFESGTADNISTGSTSITSIAIYRLIIIITEELFLV